MSEEQPQSPELGEAVQLDTAETLEGDPDGDPLDAGYIAPDRPSAAEGYGSTAEETYRGESLSDKLSEEEPDVSPDDLGADQTRAGRLVADDEGAHGDETAEAVGHDVGISGGAASAEEAAVHVEEDPPR